MSDRLGKRRGATATESHSSSSLGCGHCRHPAGKVHRRSSPTSSPMSWLNVRTSRRRLERRPEPGQPRRRRGRRRAPRSAGASSPADPLRATAPLPPGRQAMTGGRPWGRARRPTLRPHRLPAGGRLAAARPGVLHDREVDGLLRPGRVPGPDPAGVVRGSASDHDPVPGAGAQYRADPRYLIEEVRGGDCKRCCCCPCPCCKGGGYWTQYTMTIAGTVAGPFACPDCADLDGSWTLTNAHGGAVCQWVTGEPPEPFCTGTRPYWTLACVDGNWVIDSHTDGAVFTFAGSGSDDCGCDLTLTNVINATGASFCSYQGSVTLTPGGEWVSCGKAAPDCEVLMAARAAETPEQAAAPASRRPGRGAASRRPGLDRLGPGRRRRGPGQARRRRQAGQGVREGHRPPCRCPSARPGPNRLPAVSTFLRQLVGK